MVLNPRITMAELTDEMVTLWIEGEHGFFPDVAKIERRLLGRDGEGVEGAGGNAKVNRRKGNNDIETLFENAVFFYQTLDELTVSDDGFLDLLGGDVLNPVVEELDILRNVFSLGTDKDLNREGKGVDQGGVGVNGGILFFVRQETKVDGGGLEHQGDRAVLEIDQMVLDGIDIELFLGAGLDVTHFNFFTLLLSSKDCIWIMATWLSWTKRIDCGLGFLSRQSLAVMPSKATFNPSNSTGLNLGLFNFSHRPRNSIVLRFLIQFLITSSVSAAPLYLAISVREIKSDSFFLKVTISTPFTVIFCCFLLFMVWLGVVMV